MALLLYNSLTKQLEDFKPLNKGYVTMYNCGPTVYDYIHVGNLRSFLMADLLRRYLEFSGYQVKQAMNITDLGHFTNDSEAGQDKIELKAQEQGKTPQEIAEFYTQAFFKDIQTLGLLPAHHYPKATDHIPEMIVLIQKLLEQGFAYEVNGSIYFSIDRFPAYGRLSGNKMSDLQAGARVEVRAEKRNPLDFALWIHDPKHLMQWDSPWGRGYPYWHLECSAMSMKYLGETIDIHTGGEDNKFPHHECEIAQSEGATGKPFVRTWLHVKHLLVNGQKMAKSLGNFYTLQDILDKGFDARAVRLALLGAHYRETLNFSFESVKAAQVVIARWDEAFEKISKFKYQSSNVDVLIKDTKEHFMAALDDDLNISKALAVINEFVGAINTSLARLDLVRAKQLLHAMVTDVVGIELKVKRVEEVPHDVGELLKAREEARKQKNWVEADRLRNELHAKGYAVLDKDTGQEVRALH